MAELALGALGVVPLIGFAIQSYQSLYTELKTFRHCSSTVRRMHEKLDVHRQVFANECKLLLRDSLGDRATVKAMMNDPKHEGWKDEGNDKSLKGLLDANYDVCARLIEYIRKTAEKLKSALACFQALKPGKQKGERMKDTWARLKDGLRMSFNKTDYEAGLDDLRGANDDLKTLREQVTQLRTPCRVITVKAVTTAPGLGDIRRAATALHEALAGAWSCGQASHIRHLVKLFLETEKAGEDVCMNIAILCHGYGRNGDASLIQLQVRSGHAAWRAPILPPLGAGDVQPKKPGKAVRFSEGPTTYTTCIATPPTAGGCTAEPKAHDAFSDLRASGDFCSALRTRCTQPTARCLGHIDVPDDLRHSFYTARSTPPRPAPMTIGDLVPMDAFLHSGSGGVLFTTADRLKMARSLVLAVLKFYATPWLADTWRLRDFSFFHQEDVAKALKTVHLGVEFEAASGMEDDIRLGDNTLSLEMKEDEVLRSGIDNMALHSLGAALLQIDRMTVFDPDDVVGVRKAAKLGSSLGPRYGEITKKCLSCDFGYGSDLSKAQLQKAVYESLIGALEPMISSLCLDDDPE